MNIGKAISIVTQYDVQAILDIEEATKSKMVEFPTDHNDVMSYLNKTLAAKQVATLVRPSFLFFYLFFYLLFIILAFG